jgi:hypothetical protein
VGARGAGLAGRVGESSLAARLRGGLDAVPDLGDARRFVTAWATRGAPLVMRAGDVRDLAAGLWPLDEADAVARLGGNGQMLRKAKVDPHEAIRTTAKAMREVVVKAKHPLTKGEVSERVTPRLPDSYSAWCRPCQATHVGESLMRMAGLPAGLRLVPDASPATLTPIGGWRALPAKPPVAAVAAVVQSYLHLYGPATPGEVGSFLQTTAKAVKAVWPEDLVEVRVDGKKAWARPDDIDALQTADPGRTDPADPELVRLLPRSDPWLLARDRERIVPGAAHRKVLWPVLGWPGAVLAGTEVVGAWRTRSSKGGTSLTVAVETFDSLPPKVRAAVEGEAAGVAAQRGAEDLTVTFT